MFKPRPYPRRSGFTLAELLVAMAILTIIVAALGTIMGTASNLTTTNDNHIDADGRARTVFDRMANDFAQMVKRSDIDFIFFKAPGGNDTMFFYTEGASYYDGASPDTSDFKNAVSLVGYRVDNVATDSANGQLQRLGKALLWDGASTARPSMVFLTYPDPETQASGSAAYAYSTLAGGTASAPTVGTSGGNFNDGTDASYHPLASNVFRFEYSFQLKDGTQSNIPVMTPSTANGIPSASLSEGGPPTQSSDSQATATTAGTSTTYAAGSRWYDTANKVGYICVDASQGNAVWHEIGIQDVSAIVVTIAVLDDQGMVFLKNANISFPTLAQPFEDSPDNDADPAGDTLKAWTSAITPPNATSKSAVSTATGIPQPMASQIRIFQRFFYINNT
jgi:prepilin-type N-terminal cleavage/methylation domain-containing protein